MSNKIPTKYDLLSESGVRCKDLYKNVHRQKKIIINTL